MTSTATRAIAALFMLLTVSVPAAGTAATDTPPTERNTLLKWLQAGNYKSWARESAAHESRGPHPVKVVAYLNAALDRSLAGQATTHPKGSAAVKELLDAAGKLAGWAVAVKTASDSDGGKGWYWYEILGTSASSQVVAAENGVALCFGCHTPGRDFVLTDHPLQ